LQRHAAQWPNRDDYATITRLAATRAAEVPADGAGCVSGRQGEPCL